jgi:hypothetical protein
MKRMLWLVDNKIYEKGVAEGIVYFEKKYGVPVKDILCSKIDRPQGFMIGNIGVVPVDNLSKNYIFIGEVS